MIKFVNTIVSILKNIRDSLKSLKCEIDELRKMVEDDCDGKRHKYGKYKYRYRYTSGGKKHGRKQTTKEKKYK